MSWVGSLAGSLGASEAAIKLILGQVAGYPLMLLYRRCVAQGQTNLQHLFFFLSGLLTAHWVIGPDVAHSLYAVAVTYLILLCASGTLLSVIVSFVFNFGYLLVGYFFTESEGYDICWTMPHCVLSLKLIGLTFDCYDGERGKRNPSVLSKDQMKSYLDSAPTLLEMLSHSFFIGGYFVGPQIPMKKYREFVRPDYTAQLPGSPIQYGLKRFLLGIFYCLLHVVGNIYLPVGWPASQHFAQHSFVTRLLLLPFWVKVILAKYIFAWLMAEGVCIFSGLSFVEKREDGSIDWRGCANVKVGRLETATCFGNVIESFNINTNHWVSVYVYKRLKFMGNQTLSQGITLIFLAVWHGFHSGYYITFFNEFLTIKVEREFKAILAKSEKVEGWKQKPWFETVSNLLGGSWVLLLLPQCFFPFSLLLWTPTYFAYSHVYFLMYILYASWWIFFKEVTKKFLKKPSSNVTAKENKQLLPPVDDEKDIKISSDPLMQNKADDPDILDLKENVLSQSTNNNPIQDTDLIDEKKMGGNEVLHQKKD